MEILLAPWREFNKTCLAGTLDCKVSYTVLAISPVIMAVNTATSFKFVKYVIPSFVFCRTVS